VDKGLKLRVFLKFCKDNHIDTSTENIEVDDRDGAVVLSDREEYLVFTDAEANKECKERILEDLWAFRASYIIQYMKGYDKLSLQQDKVLIDTIEKIQELLCEGANPIIEAIIQNMDSFIQDSIEADGRGHFLASYDNNENEVTYNRNIYYVYRRN